MRKFKNITLLKKKMNSKIAGENHRAKSYGREGDIVHHISEKRNIIIVTKHFAFTVSFWKCFFLFVKYFWWWGGRQQKYSLSFEKKKKKN